MKEPQSAHMQELKRLGPYLVKNRRCALTYARQTSEATLQVHVDSDWAGDLLRRKSTTGVILTRGKHILRHMHVCRRLSLNKRSGRVLRCDPRSMNKLENSITQPGLDDRNSDTDLQRQFRGKEWCKKTWNSRTSKTRHFWLQSRITLGHLKVDTVAGD